MNYSNALRLLILSFSISLLVITFMISRYHVIVYPDKGMLLDEATLYIKKDRELDDFIKSLENKVPVFEINESEFGKNMLFNK